MALFVCKQCGAEYPAWSGPCAKCGCAEHVALKSPASREGTTVAGRYKLIRRLGEGGMGAVYLAEQLGVGNQVAIKFLKPELSQNEGLARRFLNEARTYIRVAHPGAVQLNDYGQDETGALYLVMELVDGVDLKHLLDERRRLEPKEAVAIALAVADVLAHAHSKGVVHRDLKPENVMVRPALSGFHVKVLDFGIAHLAYEGAERLTQTGALAGTPKYMSPEQVRGEAVDARTDVYALGLLLFELLTGRSAFEGGSVSEILHQQATQPVPSLAAVDAHLGGPALDLVVAKATQKRKEDRYQTMAELAQALSALPASELQPSSAPLPPPGANVVPAEETDPTYVSQARRPLATPSPPTAPPPKPPPAAEALAGAARAARVVFGAHRARAQALHHPALRGGPRRAAGAGRRGLRAHPPGPRGCAGLRLEVPGAGALRRALALDVGEPSWSSRCCSCRTCAPPTRRSSWRRCAARRRSTPPSSATASTAPPSPPPSPTSRR